jgi:hypothetical protein
MYPLGKAEVVGRKPSHFENRRAQKDVSDEGSSVAQALAHRGEQQWNNP